MGTLLDILNDLINGRGKLTRELGRGLRLQFKKADAEWDNSRLFCYRVNQAPSEQEIKTVTDHLKLLLPLGTEIHVEYKKYPATEGGVFMGKVLSWGVSSFQPPLVDVPASAQMVYTEAK